MLRTEISVLRKQYLAKISAHLCNCLGKLLIQRGPGEWSITITGACSLEYAYPIEVMKSRILTFALIHQLMIQTSTAENYLISPTQYRSYGINGGLSDNKLVAISEQPFHVRLPSNSTRLDFRDHHDPLPQLHEVPCPWSNL